MSRFQADVLSELLLKTTPRFLGAVQRAALSFDMMSVLGSLSALSLLKCDGRDLQTRQERYVLAEVVLRRLSLPICLVGEAGVAVDN